MDLVKRLEWWLEQEAPEHVPPHEIGVGGEVRCLREDVAEVADEIERLTKIEVVAKIVLARFQADEANGYRSRDREYVIELFGKYVPSANEQSTLANKEK